MLERIGVEHRPADPLDQLTGEVIGLEVGGGNPLAIHDCARLLLWGIGNDEYLRHGVPPSLGARAPSRRNLGRRSKLGKDSVSLVRLVGLLI